MGLIFPLKSSCQKPLDRMQYILQKCSFGDSVARLFKPFGFVYIENLKNPLVRNHWTDFHIILQKCSIGDPLPRLFKPFGFVKKHGRQGAGLILPIYLYRKLKKSCHKPLDWFPYNFAEMFLWWSSTKIVQAIWIRQKTWRPGGRGLFSLYIYIEQFKNHLVRNHWTDFRIILQKCSFGDTLPRLFEPFGFVKKHGRQGQGLFSLYIYIENFKNLLVRKHRTDFNIFLQKCSFGDPLPRLFKPFGFFKKHGHQGTGLIFPIYLYRKL